MFNAISVLYPRRAVDNTNTPISGQATTVSTAAVSATSFNDAVSSGGNGVSLVTFDVQTSNVRVRFDGTNPTSTVGHLLYAGQNYTWPTSLYNAAKFIRDTSAAADATLFASPLNA